jgi:integrase
LDYALQRDHIEANPAINLSKVVPALKQNHRERILSEAELKALWPQLTPQLKLILVTAQRPGEVAGMHTNETQIGENKSYCLKCRRCGSWTIPPERAKNGKEHIVHLTHTAFTLIKDTEGYSFPSSIEDKSIHSKAMSTYVRRAQYYGLPRWTPHDLRRTARTYMAKLGVPDEHAEAVIAHSKRGMVKIYNRHEYQEEKKAALILWETELLKIVG